MELSALEFYGREGTKELAWDRSTAYAQSWALVFYLLRVAKGEALELRNLIAQRMDSGRCDQAKLRRSLAELLPRWRAFVMDETQVALDGKARQARAKLDQGGTDAALTLAREVL